MRGSPTFGQGCDLMTMNPVERQRMRKIKDRTAQNSSTTALTLNNYQREAQRTDQQPGKSQRAMIIPLLGLAGEAGTLLAEYKKLMRDGVAHARFAEEVRGRTRRFALVHREHSD